MRRGVTAIVFFLYVITVLSCSAHAVEPLRMAYPTFAPFHYLNKNGEMEGLFHDIISEAVETRLGVPLVWTDYPWARCQQNVKRGHDDAITTVPTRERAEYTRTHDTPFYLKTLNLFTYKDHPELEKIRGIETIADIRKLGFSVITYSGNGWHEKHVASLGIKTYEAGSLDSVWLMLSMKRGDLVIEWPASSWPDLRRLGLADKVVDSGVVVSEMAFHLLIRSGSPHVGILERFDETVEAMRRDGTFATIESRYQ